MTRPELVAYLLGKKGAVEERPFGPDVAVMKVMGKMFALVPDADPLQMNLKCDPDEALVLREMYTAITPGYHMNKKHWNTVVVDGSLPKSELQNMIDESYRLVVKGLKKADRQTLAMLE